MTVEQRLDNLENLVNALIKRIDKDKFYSQADTNAIRQNVSDITPFTATKTAYIDDTEIQFENVPQGNLTVFLDIPYEVSRNESTVVITFEALEEVKEITIMIN